MIEERSQPTGAYIFYTTYLFHTLFLINFLLPSGSLLHMTRIFLFSQPPLCDSSSRLTFMTPIHDSLSRLHFVTPVHNPHLRLAVSR